MKRFFLMGVLLGSFGALPGEELMPMPQEFLASGDEVWRESEKVNCRRYPDADSVMLSDRIHIAYEADGSYTVWDDEWIKVLTEKGRRGQSALRIAFSQRYGNAKIELVEIVGTNGVARTVDFQRTLKTATDNSAVSANIYDPLDKHLACAVPGLQVGEIRHVRFCRREHKPRMKGAWAHTELLQYSSPVIHAKVSVSSPSALPLRHAAVRHALEPALKSFAPRDLPIARRLYAWEVRDVPQVFPEPSMPPLAEEVQSLKLSTVEDYPAISRWYWQLCRSHLAASSPAITNQVRALVSPCTNALDKVRAIFRFVSQEIRYMGLTAETHAPGYEPHDVKLTFEKRYGVCRDKAALLAHMLEIAGFCARPVLIHAGRKMDEEIPSPYFNHAITAVKLKPGDDWLLMDPTDEMARDLLPAYLSDRSYLVADKIGEPLRTSPIVPVHRNLLKVASTGSILPDSSAVLTSRFSFGGINDTAFRHLFVKAPEPRRRRILEEFLRRVSPGAELLSFEFEPDDLRLTDREMSLVTVARFPEVVLRARACNQLALPFITDKMSVVGSLLSDCTALEKRSFPLKFSTTAGVEETLVLNLPDDLGELEHLPEKCDLGAAGYESCRDVKVADGVLTARRLRRIGSLRFEVPEYEKLRDALRLEEASERAQVIFKRRENLNSDVKTLLKRREVVFSSPHAWVETNTTEQLVLTYAGKKRASELSFSYSPLTRSVEIVSASVSNKNGRVYTLAPGEINVLDCSWAAAAPRYPASKTLVANLPAVEVGSVIRYTLAHTVTNSPLAYSAFTILDSKEALSRITLKYDMPSDMRFKWRTTNLENLDAIVLSDIVGSRRRFAVSIKSPPQVPDEPSQAPASLWRPTLFVTAADWREYAEELGGALARARSSGTEKAALKTAKLTQNCPDAAAKITAVRRFLARNVRRSGPGIFELPFNQAFTAADRILDEGYASRADYHNLMFVMLTAAGFDCDFVFSAGDGASDKRLTRIYEDELPRPSLFNIQVLRARMDGKTYYLAQENEYTPANCSGCEGDTYFDLGSLSFGELHLDERCRKNWYNPLQWFTGPTLTSSPPGSSPWSPRTINSVRMLVREDGGVDFDVTNIWHGVASGVFRKRFAEMLPEKRSRYFQTLLGDIAHGASATRELALELEAYPVGLSFSAFASDYAHIEKDTITLQVPDLDDEFLAVGELTRKTPIAVGGTEESQTLREIIFPKGYTQINHLPEAYVLKSPVTGEIWAEFTVSAKVKDERLSVNLCQIIHRREAVMLGKDYFSFIRDWNHRLASKAGRTISVRRKSLSRH